MVCESARLFSNQADTDGRPPGQGRNKRRKHSCASHSPEPAGTNSKRKKADIFGFLIVPILILVQMGEG